MTLNDDEPGNYRTLDVPVVDGFATLPNGRVVASNAQVVRVPYLTPENHDRLMAAMFPEPEPDVDSLDVDSLDGAWAEVEVILPKGWHIELIGAPGIYVASAGQDHKPLSINRAGRTRLAALRTLAAALREMSP